MQAYAGAHVSPVGEVVQVVRALEERLRQAARGSAPLIAPAGPGTAGLLEADDAGCLAGMAAIEGAVAPLVIAATAGDAPSASARVAEVRRRIGEFETVWERRVRRMAGLETAETGDRRPLTSPPQSP